jgi:hypothetical protein
MTDNTLLAEAVEHNAQFAELDEVQRTTVFPVRPADDNFDAEHIRNAEGNCLPVATIKAWTDSLAEEGGDAQRGRVPGQIDAFVESLTDSDGLPGDAPDPNDPEWDGFTTDIWFGFPSETEVEVLLTYFRP